MIASRSLSIDLFIIAAAILSLLLGSCAPTASAQRTSNIFLHNFSDDALADTQDTAPAQTATSAPSTQIPTSPSADSDATADTAVTSKHPGTGRGIPQFVVNRFKEEHLLKDDYNPPGQVVVGNRVIMTNSDGSEDMISLNPEDLEEMQVFTPGAEYYLDDEKQAVIPRNVFRSKADPAVMVVKDSKSGKLKSVSKTDPQTGRTVTLEKIEEDSDTFVEISSDDLDEEKLQQYEYGETADENPEFSQRRRFLRQVDQTIMREVRNQTSSNSRRSLSELEGMDLTIKVAIAFESEFCSKVDGSSKAFDIVANVVAAASLKYEVFGLKVQISYLEGYCNGNRVTSGGASSDPYAAMKSEEICSQGILGSFAQYWRNNRQNVDRSVAHLFYGYERTTTSVIGCAWRGVLCWDEWGYAVNEMSFKKSSVLQMVLFAHELGHNAGSSHDCDSDGTNCIFDYIMAPSIGEYSSFSPNSIEQIIAEVQSVIPQSCLQPVSSPTNNPTPFPTKNPTPQPTRPPSPSPTRRPTPQPTRPPSPSPTRRPTPQPTKPPSPSPTRRPTPSPTKAPVIPTAAPTTGPPTTLRPTVPPVPFDLTVDIVLDDYPAETSVLFEYLDGGPEVLFSYATGDLVGTNKIYQTFTDLAGGQYHLRLEDSAGDGICCSKGSGQMQILNGNKDLIWSAAGSFGGYIDVVIELNGVGRLASSTVRSGDIQGSDAGTITRKPTAAPTVQPRVASLGGSLASSCQVPEYECGSVYKGYTMHKTTTDGQCISKCAYFISFRINLGWACGPC